MCFNTHMKWGSGILFAVERKQGAETGAHRPQSDCQFLISPACHTASGIKHEDRSSVTNHPMWPNTTESFSCTKVLPRGGVVGTAESYFVLEILFSKATLRKFLLETLLIAIDTAAQFTGDMEGIGLQQHLRPFLMLAHETSFQQVKECRSFKKSHRKH